METLPVDANGDGSTVLAYLDSGAPTSNAESYTTLVCVHGHSYHAQNFARLFPLAYERNLRIIALNRRDYKGSTLYSPEELSALPSLRTDGKDTEKAQAGFLTDRGFEIARFLVRMIKDKDIPNICDNGDHGGIVLVGWSLGAITTLAFLANMSTYPCEIRELLSSHLRALLVYDLPNNSTGTAPPTSGAYHPLDDAKLPARVRGFAFGTWVSSYYSHPAYSRSRSRSPADLGVIVGSGDARAHNGAGSTPVPNGKSEMRARRRIQDLEVRSPTYPFRKCTLDTLAPSDLLACVDVAPGARSEHAIWKFPQDLLLRQTERAFVLTSAEDYIESGDNLAEELKTSEKMMLRNLKVAIIHGTASLWCVQWETWGLEELLERWKVEGRQLRPIKFIPVPEANHFLHWDDPEQFLEVCLDAVNT